MLPVCTDTLKPYVVGSQNSVGIYADSAAYSSGAACQLFAASTGNTLRSVNAESCSIAAVTNAYPVVLQCQMSPDMASYDYTAGAGLWAFSLTGILVVYFAAHGIGLVLKAVREG